MERTRRTRPRLACIELHPSVHEVVIPVHPRQRRGGWVPTPELELESDDAYCIMCRVAVFGSKSQGRMRKLGVTENAFSVADKLRAMHETIAMIPQMDKLGDPGPILLHVFATSIELATDLALVDSVQQDVALMAASLCSSLLRECLRFEWENVICSAVPEQMLAMAHDASQWSPSSDLCATPSLGIEICALTVILGIVDDVLNASFGSSHEKAECDLPRRSKIFVSHLMSSTLWNDIAAACHMSSPDFPLAIKCCTSVLLCVSSGRTELGDELRDALEPLFKAINLEGALRFKNDESKTAMLGFLRKLVGVGALEQIVQWLLSQPVQSGIINLLTSTIAGSSEGSRAEALELLSVLLDRAGHVDKFDMPGFFGSGSFSDVLCSAGMLDFCFEAFRVLLSGTSDADIGALHSCCHILCSFATKSRTHFEATLELFAPLVFGAFETAASLDVLELCHLAFGVRIGWVCDAIVEQVILCGITVLSSNAGATSPACAQTTVRVCAVLRCVHRLLSWFRPHRSITELLKHLVVHAKSFAEIDVAQHYQTSFAPVFVRLMQSVICITLQSNAFFSLGNESDVCLVFGILSCLHNIVSDEGLDALFRAAPDEAADALWELLNETADLVGALAIPKAFGDWFYSLCTRRSCFSRTQNGQLSRAHAMYKVLTNENPRISACFHREHFVLSVAATFETFVSSLSLSAKDEHDFDNMLVSWLFVDLSMSHSAQQQDLGDQFLQTTVLRMMKKRGVWLPKALDKDESKARLLAVALISVAANTFQHVRSLAPAVFDVIVSFLSDGLVSCMWTAWAPEEWERFMALSLHVLSDEKTRFDLGINIVLQWGVLERPCKMVILDGWQPRISMLWTCSQLLETEQDEAQTASILNCVLDLVQSYAHMDCEECALDLNVLRPFPKLHNRETSNLVRRRLMLVLQAVLNIPQQFLSGWDAPGLRKYVMLLHFELAGWLADCRDDRRDLLTEENPSRESRAHDAFDRVEEHSFMVACTLSSVLETGVRAAHSYEHLTDLRFFQDFAMKHESFRLALVHLHGGTHEDLRSFLWLSIATLVSGVVHACQAWKQLGFSARNVNQLSSVCASLVAKHWASYAALASRLSVLAELDERAASVTCTYLGSVLELPDQPDPRAGHEFESVALCINAFAALVCSLNQSLSEPASRALLAVAQVCLHAKLEIEWISDHLVLRCAIRRMWVEAGTAFCSGRLISLPASKSELLLALSKLGNDGGRHLCPFTHEELTSFLEDALRILTPRKTDLAMIGSLKLVEFCARHWLHDESESERGLRARCFELTQQSKASPGQDSR
ncbi:hypothetical protein FVE85_3978 [Porphyridium purpureum]|uniref:Uncharacterized protein n=1 Tax=Porphyridium purpureum TaxID=35688 RepID=A0A5J4YT73_PORPP|nr:hypothetical protein FVE85_3978 [Porphyridium purpureum]|eukprot:POR6085..scf229_5